MLGNACEACGLEHVDDNTLQSHVSNNIKCRRKIQHSRAQRLVEAYRDALRARRGAKPQTPVRYTNNNGGVSVSGGEVDPAAVVDQPDDPIVPTEESDGEESVMSHIDDGFNALIELYIFFREADLSRREVNRLLSIFQNPKFLLRDHIVGFVTKPRADEEDTKDVRHYSTPNTEKWCHEAQWANYAAFEHRGMMQVMPLLIADSMAKSKPEEKEKRQREVAAFVAYASFYKAHVGVTKHTDDTLDDVRAMAVT
ncbi:unnamed protein product [Closterium sp. NIES-54]